MMRYAKRFFQKGDGGLRKASEMRSARFPSLRSRASFASLPSARNDMGEASFGGVAASLCLAIAISCFIACSSKSAGGDESDKADSVAEVTVTKVARADVTSALTVTGTIAALPNR